MKMIEIMKMVMKMKRRRGGKKIKKSIINQVLMVHY
jgi:hypothetical protein